MADKIPARFRKTKTDKWAVMAPIEDLEAALAADGKVDVLKKSGDWSTFRVASLGKPFDVDGVQMCYGYGPDEDSDGGGGGAARSTAPAADRPGPPPSGGTPAGPGRDPSEPMPEFQGGPEDEWSGF